MKIQFTESEVKTMQTALDRWGLNAQVGVAVEECAELIVVLKKYVNRSKKPDVDEILDEIADVEMMLAQMRLSLGIDDDTLRKRIEHKFGKLNQYLSEQCDSHFYDWHECVIGGHETFVPISFVQDGKLNRDYNPTELSAKVGDILIVQEIVNAWLIVENVEGVVGWIPAENVVSAT